MASTKLAFKGNNRATVRAVKKALTQLLNMDIRIAAYNERPNHEAKYLFDWDGNLGQAIGDILDRCNDAFVQTTA